MKAIEEVFCSIGRDPKPFLVGWLSGIIGAILGLALALKF